MSRNLIIFGIILLLLIGFAYFAFGGFSGKTAKIGNQTIQLEIADSPQEREKGLSGRDSLAKNKGLLFVFEQPGEYQFWMKDMKFPIDIVYLKDNKVVTIYHNVPAKVANNQNLTLYSPKEPVNRVLELPAGRAKELGLKEGSIVELNI